MDYLRNPDFFQKFTKYGLFSTLQALYILIVVSFIYLNKEKLEGFDCNG